MKFKTKKESSFSLVPQNSSSFVKNVSAVDTLYFTLFIVLYFVLLPLEVNLSYIYNKGSNIYTLAATVKSFLM
jgi:hypothetical protein